MSNSNDYRWDYLDPKAYNNRIGKYKFKREYNFIISNAKYKFDSILDVAGGSGRFSIPLQKYSNDITVIDHNETAINLLKERSNQITAIYGDIIDSDINEKYTTILCIEALGYIQNKKEFFEKISGLLSKDGRIIITINNPDSWRYLLRKIKFKFLGTDHYPYNEIKLINLYEIFEDCKLVVEKMEGMNWIPLPLNSNNIFIPFFEFIEKKFKLNKWYSQSPWLLISLKKK